MAKVFNVFNTTTGRLVKVRPHFGGSYESTISKSLISIFNAKKNRAIDMPIECPEELRQIINTAQENHRRIVEEESVLPLLGQSNNVRNFAYYNHLK